MTIPNRDFVAEIELTASKASRSILTHDAAIGKRAKTWGCDMLNAIKVHDFDSDDLIGKTKKAAGWNVLVGKAGTRAKSVFNRWFSNLRTILEQWNDIPEDIRTDLLGGTRSFLSVVESRQKAEREATKAAKAEKAAEDKANETGPAQMEGKGAPLGQIIREMAALFASLNDEQLVELTKLQPELLAMSEAMNTANDKAFALIEAILDQPATGTDG
jgi:hypothetical protein